MGARTILTHPPTGDNKGAVYTRVGRLKLREIPP